MIVFARGTRATGPAELILAEAARHMVAALVLFNLCAAHWAERHVILVFFRPTLKLLFHCIFTRLSSVPSVTALEADFSLTLITDKLFTVSIWCSHVLLATSLGTPSD